MSVVLPTHGGVAWIGGALDSVAAQTLDPDLFELVVVVNGDDDGTASLVESFRATHPALTVRLLRTAAAGYARAVNLGIAAARRDHVTMLDDDDTITPQYLDVLLRLAGTDVVGQAFLVDVDGDEEELSTYVNRSLGRAMGRTVHPRDAGSALSFNTAKIVATDLAVAHPMRTDLRRSPDIVFWHTLVNDARLDVRVAEPDQHAFYRRWQRPGSHSRPDDSWETAVEARLDTMAALAPIGQDPAQHLHEVSARTQRSEARLVAAWMRDHPDEHPRLVTAVRDRGLDDAVWPLLNEGRARDLAFVYMFVPAADTSALVAARRIRGRGVATDVVSHDVTSVRSTDRTAASVVAPWLGRRRVVAGKALFGSWAHMVAFAEESVRVAAAWAEESGPYRTLYSRSMWPASHVAAAAWRLQHPETVWTAEFSDPLSRTVEGDPRPGAEPRGQLADDIASAVAGCGHPADPARGVHAWIEHATMVLADRVLFTNEHQRTYMLSLLPEELAREVRAKSVVEHHPTPAPELYEQGGVRREDPEDVLSIAYFGAFYVTRTMQEVTGAIRTLPVADRDRLRLHVYTSDPDAVREALGDAPELADVVVPHPFVDYLDFLGLCAQHDVLLVNDYATASSHDLNPYLPSKYSDYAGAPGARIWGVVEPGSVLDGLPLAHRSTLGDVEGARAVLESLLHGDGR